MKSISISRRSKVLNQLLQQARQQDVLLESPDGEQFVLVKLSATRSLKDIQAFVVGDTDDFAEEVRLTRENAGLMEFLDRRAAQSKPGSGTSLEELRRRLNG
jgi:hypothetical protein